MHFYLARAGGGELFGGGGGDSGGSSGGSGGFGGGTFIFGGGGGGIGLIIIVLLVTLALRTMGRGGWRRGPWRGGPWGGVPRGGGQWGGRRQGPWSTGGQSGPGSPGSPGSGNGTNGSMGGPPAGGDAGWTAGGGSAPAGGDAGWAAGGGGTAPAGGGWNGAASSGNGNDADVPARSGRGAGERLSSVGAAWPGDDNPDWMHDTRPAAASIPGEIFPERHARAMQAASPVDVGLAAIKGHDPRFDLEQFTQQVQRSFFIVQEAWSERKPEMSRQVMADSLWQQHRDQIQGYIDGHKRNMLDYLAVSNVWPVAAGSDSTHDTITVRIMAACADYDVDDKNGRVVRGDQQVRQWAEDWTFQRSSQAVTKEGGTALAAKCPNCGAPLDVDLAGVCRYCKAPIMSGQYDWVLARISQVG
jgi:predicted lipid-binding transport protein (Tim44 family)